MALISRSAILFLSYFAWILMDPAVSLGATRASIVDLELSNQHGILAIGFTIDNCFTPKMEEAILSGVPTTFRIRVILENRRWIFFKSSKLDVTLNRTIKYEGLKREFRVLLPETTQIVHTTPSFSEAKDLMSRVVDLPVIPMWRLEEDKEYTLGVKAELSKVDLPLFFRYILFFVSLWDFETDWHKTRVSLGSFSSAGDPP